MLVEQGMLRDDQGAQKDIANLIVKKGSAEDKRAGMREKKVGSREIDLT